MAENKFLLSERERLTAEAATTTARIEKAVATVTALLDEKDIDVLKDELRKVLAFVAAPERTRKVAELESQSAALLAQAEKLRAAL